MTRGTEMAECKMLVEQYSNLIQRGVELESKRAIVDSQGLTVRATKTYIAFPRGLQPEAKAAMYLALGGTW